MMECKRCINKFEIQTESKYEGRNIYSYCKIGVNVNLDNVIRCPFYKPKAKWEKVEDEIKEEPKHIKRIEKQRKRFEIRKRATEKQLKDRKKGKIFT